VRLTANPLEPYVLRASCRPRAKKRSIFFGSRAIVDVNGLVAAAGQTVDPNQRLELLQQAETLLLEQAPIAPLVFGARNFLIDPAVHGWEPAPLGIYQYKKIYLDNP